MKEYRRGGFLRCGAYRLVETKLDQFTLTTPGALFASAFPVLRRFKVAAPEWPSLALSWPSIIEFAFSGFFVQEHAVIATGKFFQTFADSDFPHVKFLEIFDGMAK